MHNHKNTSLPLAGLLLALLAAALLQGCGNQQEKISYTTTKVEKGDVVARVTATGTLSALVTVDVGSQVSGRIRELMADFNSQVKKGQVIARIDSASLEAELAQRKANVAAARGNLAGARAAASAAQRKYARYKDLVDQGLVSRDEYEATLSTHEQADASVLSSLGALAQAEAALNQTTINLGYTTIISPTDGIVISRSVNVGQTVAASLQAPVLFTIAQDLRQMQVDTNVSESDVGKLADGMPVMFSVDAYPNERFRGKVRQIRNAPLAASNVVTYDAVIDVANDDLRLKPGMTANVTFTWAERRDVLRVPNAALRFRPPADQIPAEPQSAGASAGAAPRAGAPGPGGNRQGSGPRRGERDPTRKTLWTLIDGKPKAVPVRSGVTDGSYTEILEGEVQEGSEIITDATGGKTAQAPQSSGPPRLF